jgi:uncharacterized protein DUF5666
MRATLSFSLALCLSVLAFGQDAPPQGAGNGPGGRGQGQFRDLTRVMGTIVSISGDQLIVKPESGDNVTVKLDSDVRIRKDRAEAKLSDFKAGDHVMAAGTLGSDKVLNAKLLAGGQMGQRGGGMGMGSAGTMGSISPEEMVKAGLGTKFIYGDVKSIDETKLTIARPDGQTQTIEVDETTSFRDGKGESGTLADIKVGDRVMGRGDMKNGVFVPQTLRFGAPQGPGGGSMMHRNPGGPPAGAPGGPPPQPQQQQPK